MRLVKKKPCHEHPGEKGLTRLLGVNGFQVMLGFTRSKSNLCRKVVVQGLAFTANNLQ